MTLLYLTFRGPQQQVIPDRDARHHRGGPAREDKAAESGLLPLRADGRGVGSRAANELHERPGAVRHQLAILGQLSSAGSTEIGWRAHHQSCPVQPVDPEMLSDVCNGENPQHSPRLRRPPATPDGLHFGILSLIQRTTVQDAAFGTTGTDDNDNEDVLIYEIALVEGDNYVKFLFLFRCMN